MLVAFVAVVHQSEGWGRFRFRLPRIRIPRIRLPRIRLPRIRLPRIRLPRIRFPRIRIRLPRIRLPWQQKCPQLPGGDALFKSIMCTTDGGVVNAGCISMCSSFGDMMGVTQYHQLCPQACKAICSMNLGKREEDEEENIITEQRGEDEFSAYDQDKDGQISGEELKSVLKVHSREVVDERALGKFLTENDVDGDGYLNKEEFLRISEKQDDEDAEEFLREMEDDSSDDDEEEPSDEEKKEYLEGLDQRMMKDELTDDDKQFVSRLEQMEVEDEKKK